MRKLWFGGTAALTALVTIVIAWVTVTTAPTFRVLAPPLGDQAALEIPVQCHAIGPGRLDTSVDLYYGDVDSYDYDDQVHEAMSSQDLYTYAKSQGLTADGSLTPAENDELRMYFATVRENTAYQCGQLRENQQTGLILTFGIGGLLLTLIGVAAILTGSRPRSPREA